VIHAVQTGSFFSLIFSVLISCFDDLKIIFKGSLFSLLFLLKDHDLQGKISTKSFRKPFYFQRIKIYLK
jgi:hypothetical protein